MDLDLADPEFLASRHEAQPVAARQRPTPERARDDGAPPFHREDPVDGQGRRSIWVGDRPDQAGDRGTHGVQTLPGGARCSEDWRAGERG